MGFVERSTLLKSIYFVFVFSFQAPEGVLFLPGIQKALRKKSLPADGLEGFSGFSRQSLCGNWKMKSTIDFIGELAP